MAHDFKKFPELTNNQMQFYYFDSPHKQINEDFNAKVIKITDGDTIRVKWSERDFDFPVRLAHIAAPEIKEHRGPESRRWLEKMILNEIVDVNIDPHNRVGKWGRIIGEISFMGINVNQMSMDMGFSIPFSELE